MNDVKTCMLSENLYNFDFAKYCITLGVNDAYTKDINKIIKDLNNLDSLSVEYNIILALCECSKYVYKTREKNKGILYAKIYYTLKDVNVQKPKNFFKVTKWSKRKHNNYRQFQYLKSVSLALSYLYGLQYKTQYTNVHKKDILKQISKANDCLLVGLKSLIEQFDDKILDCNLQTSLSTVYDFC